MLYDEREGRHEGDVVVELKDNFTPPPLSGEDAEGECVDNGGEDADRALLPFKMSSCCCC